MNASEKNHDKILVGQSLMKRILLKAIEFEVVSSWSQRRACYHVCFPICKYLETRINCIVLNLTT